MRKFIKKRRANAMNYFKFCRCLMIGILMGLLMIVEISAEEFDGVEFPAGSISFADSVSLFTAGSYTEQTKTSNVLGAPDYAGGTDGSAYLSLGNGGTLVLKFTDNALTTSGDSDLDLWIFEVGNAVEATDVYISKDGSDWIAVGHISGSTSGIDIDAYVSNGVVVGEEYLYVKLVDDYNDDYQTGVWAGADIDAVGAISSVAIPLPAECTVEINGITVSGTKTIGSQVTFTTYARNSCSNTLYYRYSVHADYGTDGYDGLHWKSMTSSEYTTESSIDYTFDEAGKYIVVVWAKNTTSDSNDGVAIVGIDVTIKDEGEEPYFPF